MFTKAIVRTPAPTIVDGVTSANLGKPVYELAIEQHAAYIEALQACGVEVHILEADPQYPDSCFVEDTAVLAEHMAIITHPGAPSRKGEEIKVAALLRQFYRPDQTMHITPPGTLEGGDVMRVGDVFYIGLSARTNLEGATQFKQFLHQFGFQGELVHMNEFLHLKTGVNYLGNDLLLVSGEFVNHPTFARFRQIEIEPAESYSANSLRVNDWVIVPAGYPTTQARIEAAGFKTLAVDTSEFRKLDGGLSCLSLRF